MENFEKNEEQKIMENNTENNSVINDPFESSLEEKPKNNNIKVIIGIIVAIIVIGGGIFAFNYFKKPNITIDTSAPTAQIQEYFGQLTAINPDLESYINENQEKFLEIFDLTKEYEYNNEIRYTKDKAKELLSFWEEMKSSYETEIQSAKSTLESLFSLFPSAEISTLLEPLTKTFDEIEEYIQNNIDAFSIYLGIKENK